MAEIDPITASPVVRSVANDGPAQHAVVSVTATARLHFGFLDPSGRGSRPFGSFGLSLDRPRTRLKLERAQALDVRGPERDRAERYLRSIAAGFDIVPAYTLKIEEAVPPHAGLGSGTQLALAVGSAFAALEGIALSLDDIAERLGRGARSGIGIATFAQGGAVLDGGPSDNKLPPLARRVAFPADWRVLLIYDPSSTGLAGAVEAAAFKTLPDFPESATAELQRRITEGALPALTEGDFATFAAQVGYLQERMGAYFAPLQGGTYTSARVGAALSWLRDRGVIGVGQSSWGPTGFAFAASADEGDALLGAAQARAEHDGLRFALAQGRNEGATIEIDGPEIR